MVSIVTTVPLVGVAAVRRCTQYVSLTGARNWWTIVWPEPIVRATALSQSTPTPHTHEFALVVVTMPVCGPLAPLADSVAPMPLDPFVPVVSAPVKLTTLMDEADDCANVAVTLTFVNAVAATARQISAVPRRTFVRTTNVQVIRR